MVAVASTIATALLLAAGCAGRDDPHLIFVPRGEGVHIVPVMHVRPPRVDITSESGIGGAQLWFDAGVEPTGLTLRLHLHGLEGLTLATGGYVVQASVAAGGEHVVSQTVTREGDAATQILRPGDPEWSEIHAGYDGTSPRTVGALPDYFDVELAHAMLPVGGDTLRVEWVDFYR